MDRVQVGGVEVAVGTRVLAVVDDGPRAGRPEVCEGDPAGGVLAEVDHDRTVGQSSQCDGRCGLDHADGRRGRPGDRRGGDRVHDHRVGPSTGEREVGGLSAHEVSAGDLTRTRGPFRPGADDGRFIVGGVEVEFSTGGELLAPAGGLAEGSDLTAVPTVGQDDLERVLSGLDRVGHIGCLGVDRLVVGGRTGRQLCRPDPAPVDERLVQAERR